MIDIKKYKLYKLFTYEELELLEDDELNTVEKYGYDAVGQKIITVNDEHNNRLTFVYEGYGKKGIMYRLIWKG